MWIRKMWMQFLEYAKEENLEAVEVAVVTESPRLVLVWRGKEIVNISRAFLDTNGAHQETDVDVEIPSKKDNPSSKREEVADVRAKWLDTLKDLNVLLPEGTGGNVRRFHRCRHRVLCLTAENISSQRPRPW